MYLATAATVAAIRIPSISGVESDGQDCFCKFAHSDCFKLSSGNTSNDGVRCEAMVVFNKRCVAFNACRAKLLPWCVFGSKPTTTRSPAWSPVRFPPLVDLITCASAAEANAFVEGAAKSR